MTDSKNPDPVQAPDADADIYAGVTIGSAAPMVAPPKPEVPAWNPEWGMPDQNGVVSDPGVVGDWCEHYKTARLPAEGNEHGLRVFFEKIADPFIPGERFMWFTLARELVLAGRKPWDWDDYRRIFRAWEKEREEREESQMALRRSEIERAERAEQNRKPGRPESMDWHNALLVAAGLQITQRWAYNIVRNGVGNRDKQEKLARIFSADPARNYPAAWELKQGGVWGRPAGRDSFKAYALSMTDEFEDYGAALATLRLAYGGKGLPASFKSLGDFLGQIEKAGIDLDPVDAVAAWKGYECWRMFT